MIEYLFVPPIFFAIIWRVGEKNPLPPAVLLAGAGEKLVEWEFSVKRLLQLWLHLQNLTYRRRCTSLFQKECRNQ